MYIYCRDSSPSQYYHPLKRPSTNIMFPPTQQSALWCNNKQKAKCRAIRTESSSLVISWIHVEIYICWDEYFIWNLVRVSATGDNNIIIIIIEEWLKMSPDEDHLITFSFWGPYHRISSSSSSIESKRSLNITIDDIISSLLESGYEIWILRGIIPAKWMQRWISASDKSLSRIMWHEHLIRNGLWAPRPRRDGWLGGVKGTKRTTSASSASIERKVLPGRPGRLLWWRSKECARRVWKALHWGYAELWL